MANTQQPKQVIAAAIQLDTVIGNTEHNIKACEHLAIEAIKRDVTWIALPEFFNTGICWDPSLAGSIEYEDGQSATFLCEFSKQNSVVIGGSFMCRVPEGGVRNRYLCFDKGVLVGKHDKDLPTMWENAFYEGGDQSDIGIIGDIDGARVGAAMCWEFIRTQTARRMKGEVDVIIGGSHWWSMPNNWPNWLLQRSEDYNHDNLIKCVQKTAQLIGAPVVHASHCNTFSCKMPGLPYPVNHYQGVLEGHTAIVDAKGQIVAHRHKDEGEGVVIAKITLGNINTTETIPDRYWLRNRTVLAAFSWHYSGFLGRRWYKNNIRNVV